MAHDAEHEERRAKWQERTLLGWLELPEAGSLKPQAAIGFRRDPGGCRLLYEATLQHRTRRTRLELGHGSGEHRLSWCHGDWRPNRILQLRLAIWGGRRGSSRAASSAFSLPEEGVGRGLRCGMSLRVSHLQIECYEQDLRGSAYEEGYRCKRSLSVRLLPGGRSRDPLQLSGSLWSRQDVSGGSLRAVFQIDAQRRLKAGLHWAGVSREATRGFSLQWDQTLPLFDSMELRLYYVRRDAGEYTLYQSVTPWQGALRLGKRAQRSGPRRSCPLLQGPGCDAVFFNAAERVAKHGELRRARRDSAQRRVSWMPVPWCITTKTGPLGAGCCRLGCCCRLLTDQSRPPCWAGCLPGLA